VPAEIIYFAVTNTSTTVDFKVLPMEPEVIAFLKRVAFSIFLSFVWLALTVIVGLKFNLAFVVGSVTPGNILFYVWMIISFIMLLIYLVKLWNKAEKW